MNATQRMTASVIALGMCVAPAAFGQGVGNLGSLPTFFWGAGTPLVGWSVDSGNPANPWIPVQLSPTGPQWVKTLVGSTGTGGVVYANPGDTFTLQELLVVAPAQSWTDWHEHILTPEWDWASPTVILANGVPAPGLNTVITPATLTTGGSIDFTFNALAPGTLIDIRKTLKYTGLSGLTFASKVEIAEYPTPEPATLALLGLGGAIALRRQNRRGLVLKRRRAGEI
jgi:hypothetical protein